jgi:hypothetical protein
MLVWILGEDGVWNRTEYSDLLHAESDDKFDALETVFLTTVEQQRVGSLPGDEAKYDVPEIPLPTRPHTSVPQTSQKEQVALTRVEDPFIRYGGRNRRASAHSLRRSGFEFDPVLPECFLRLRVFWDNVATFVIDGPQKFERKISTSEGMSKTEQSTLGASLGIKVDFLSAKLSGELKRSITISNEKSITDTYKVDVPSGTTVTYTLWQLIEEFDFLTSEGEVFDWRGRIRPKEQRQLPMPGQPPTPHIGSMRARFDGGKSVNYKSTYASRPVSFDL